MTTPQSQCTNLELSKKLKELGYPQESLFWHEINNMDGGIPTGEVIYSADGIKPIFYSYDYISAPTVAELLEVTSNKYPGIRFDMTRTNLTNEWLVSLNETEQIVSDSVPNALAKLLIHLLENKLIEL